MDRRVREQQRSEIMNCKGNLVNHRFFDSLLCSAFAKKWPAISKEAEL